MSLIKDLKTLLRRVPREPVSAPVSLPKKILIVEDDEVLREFYVNYLNQRGYLVLKAANGQEGLTLVFSEKPDLVILDLIMPVMDGKTMLGEIRKIPDYGTLPVIILTNEGSLDNIRETQFYNNADVFLIKCNTTPDLLLEAVKKLI